LIVVEINFGEFGSSGVLGTAKLTRNLVRMESCFYLIIKNGDRFERILLERGVQRHKLLQGVGLRCEPGCSAAAHDPLLTEAAIRPF
jgi:hypothetical protein